MRARGRRVPLAGVGIPGPWRRLRVSSIQPRRIAIPETSRELTQSFPGLQEELRVESASLKRDLLIWQRWIRYGAAAFALAGGFVMVLRSADSSAWGPFFASACIYLLFNVLVAWFLKHASPDGLPPALPAVVLAVDLIAVAGLVYLSAAPAHYYRILLLGILVLQLAVYYFGTVYAFWLAAATVGLYVVASFVAPPFVPGVRPTAVVASFNTAYFVFVAGVLVFAFGSFRRRMNQLRAFCKRVEVGDLTVTYDADREPRPDDLTLLARSVDGMRHTLIEMVGTDPLTECLNRRAFETRLGREWRNARRRGSMLAVIAVDLDNFKPINDTHGHPVGDQVLCELVDIMRKTARDTDYIARIGGDEFVLLLPDATWQGATTFAERLRRHVDDHVFCDGTLSIPVTISLGVAVARGSDDVPPEFLLEEADRSLYKAKTAGRNRISA